MENAKRDTKCPNTVESLVGFDSLKDEDQEVVTALVKAFAIKREEKFSKSKQKTTSKASSAKKVAPKKEVEPKQTKISFEKIESKSSLDLSNVVPREWYETLKPLIEEIPQSNDVFGTGNTLPDKLHIFDSIKGIEPRDVKLMIIGPSPLSGNQRASGYAFHDASNTTFKSGLSKCMNNIVEAAKSHAPTMG